ncbi:response regulator [Coralloluteibacterium thermophilus]|uniref:histidine kinase n=1 Tax=Coralloluteibacterium thermophilum TaxID=2707049 RepID=A0ABV9NR61_9GAMM
MRPDDALLQGWDDVAWDGEIVVSEFDVEPEDTRTPATAAPVSEEPAPAGIAAADPAPADEAEAAPASPVAADEAPTGGTAHHDDSAFAGAPDWQVGADGQDATGQDADAPLAFGPEDLAEAERAFADAGSLETAPVSEEPTWDFAAFVDADALASVEAIQPEAPASADANADADAPQAEHAAAPEVLAQAGPAFGETEGVDPVVAHATGTPTAVAAQGERAPAQAPAPAAPVDPDAPLDLDGVDVELLDIFLEEAADLLDHSDGMLATLRETPSEREAVIGLQRDLHTLKGGARMAGLHAIGELGHSMETLLEAVAENRLDLDGAGVGLLERAFDRLQVMVERTGARRAVAFPQQLIAELEAAATGQVVAPVPAAPAQAPTPDMVDAAAVPSLASIPDEPAAEAPVPPPAVPVASAPTAAEPVDATESASADAPEAQPVAPVAAVVATRLAPGELPPLSPPIEELEPEDDAGTARAPQEQVRIRADLLDRLVNYAGEVAIYRARLEQQLGAFRGNLGELDQTIGRLREQLRRLEIETEAQIASRYQREQETGDPAFDPLELDRFSTQQQLTRGLAETAADLVSLQGVLDEHTRQYETLLVQQSRVSSDLQEGLMRTRMVPFESLVPRLRRVLRQAAAETGKQVQLRVDGAQGEMDRNVLEHMTAPLEHMLRNAVAHGIETPDVRAAAGKPEEGTVRVAVAREGSEVVLTISDDGRGMNREAIRTKAIERGLLAEGAEVSDADLYAFTLEAGFSTAGEVSRLAGRGVGMDVVHNQIRQLGGSLSIASQAGRGAEFSVRLPFTLAVTQAVFVRIGETSYAVPIASVRGVGRIERAELESQLAGGRPVYRYADEDYAIHDLGQLLGMAAARAQDSLQMPLLLLRSGDMRAAICVDQVQGSREIVVKPVGPQVNSIPGIFGATIMGDGRVVVILDVAPLVRRQLGSGGAQSAVPQLPAFEPRHVPLVMVVDDSITMRKVTGRVLERHNLEVLTAKDGVDAIEKLAERVPDLMLLDIEMPRMDGYELATHMKNDPRLREIPIVMITSRTGDKHRQRAFEIGVDRYLGKPYQEADLMHHVYELLSLEVAHG